MPILTYSVEKLFSANQGLWARTFTAVMFIIMRSQKQSKRPWMNCSEFIPCRRMNYSSNDQRGWISGRWHWANKASCRRIYQLWSCVGRKLRSVWTKGIHLYDHKDEITMQTKVRIVVMSSWGGRWIELGMGEMPRPLPFFFSLTIYLLIYFFEVFLAYAHQAGGGHALTISVFCIPYKLYSFLCVWYLIYF